MKNKKSKSYLIIAAFLVLAAGGCGGESEEHACVTRFNDLQGRVSNDLFDVQSEWSVANCAQYESAKAEYLSFLSNNRECLEQNISQVPDGISSWNNFFDLELGSDTECPCPNDIYVYVDDPTELVVAYSNDPSDSNCQALKSAIQNTIDKASELPSRCYSTIDEEVLDEWIDLMNTLPC